MLLTLSDGMDSFLQLCTVLFLFVLVLFVTWLATKWIARVQGSVNAHNVNIETVETYRLTANKYIQIVRTGEKYLAVAICKDTVTMLTEVSEQELILSDGSVPKAMGFKDILDKVQRKTILEKEDGRDE